MLRAAAQTAVRAHEATAVRSILRDDDAQSHARRGGHKHTWLDEGDLGGAARRQMEEGHAGEQDGQKERKNQVVRQSLGLASSE